MLAPAAVPAVAADSEGWAGHAGAESAGLRSPAASCWNPGHVTTAER